MVDVLITGGAGFIASSLADRLLRMGGHRVVIVDNLRTGRLENVPVHPDCTFIRCDVNEYRDIAPVMSACRFRYVFHYAALVGVERTLANPVEVLRDITGIENILRLSKNTGVRRVFYASSSEVYGEPVTLPQHEHTTPLNSRLPYAIVKNVGEAYCRSFQQEYGLDYTVFRFFNTYGPRQSPDFVMSRFLRAALRGDDITVYGDGSQSRTSTPAWPRSATSSTGTTSTTSAVPRSCPCGSLPRRSSASRAPRHGWCTSPRSRRET
jgi:UDP-glucose 4-epimerase